MKGLHRGYSLMGLLLVIGISGPIILSTWVLFSYAHSAAKLNSGNIIQKQLEIQLLQQQIELDTLNTQKCFACRGEVLSYLPKSNYLGDIQSQGDFQKNYQMRFANDNAKVISHSALFFDTTGEVLASYIIKVIQEDQQIAYCVKRVSQNRITHQIEFSIFGDWDFEKQDQSMPRFVYDDNTKVLTVLFPTLLGYGSMQAFNKTSINPEYFPREVFLRCGKV